ncbi:FAD-dependent oxidoreductase [Frigoribacterium sp. 2-23]|uniref:FAD-dependent oxidoreductase n=1 Tax=Frigoribacterium sp. 2-23 TaxID=3415006 RepID=UPI003C6F28F3
MTAVETVDHVVVGAGLVGAATARALAATGARVVVIERFGRGHHLGSSHGASRIFRRGYTADDYVALTGRAYDDWRALEAETGRVLLETTGAVDHGDPATIDAIQAAFVRAGIDHERLTPDEAQRRWPGLRFDTTVLTHGQAGRLRSADAIEGLLDSASAHGAELRFDTRLVDLDVSGPPARLEIESRGGARRPLETPSVVLAVGSWAPALVGSLFAAAGASLPPVRVTQEQPAHFATSLPDEAWPSFVHYPSDPRLSAVVSSVYGLLTPGEGVKVGTHGTGVEVDPDRRDFEPTADGLAVLRDYVSTWVPGVDVDTLDPISCLYDTTPTEDFVLDRVGPVTVATGFAGHGFKFGPTLGALLADVATGTPAPERFRLARA